MKQTITIIITLHLSGVSEYKGGESDPPAQFAAKHGARVSQHGNMTQRDTGEHLEFLMMTVFSLEYSSSQIF